MTRPHNFTSAQRREIKARANNRCQRCGCDITHKRWRANHIIPVALGGESVVENGEALCEPCDKPVTAADVSRIRKADRQANRHAGVRPETKFRRMPKPSPVADPDAKVRRLRAAQEKHQMAMSKKGQRP